MISLTIVIPVKDDGRRLATCLRAIAGNGLTATRTTVIVADNGSTDDSRGVAAKAGARVLVLPGLRVSELRNAAAAAAGTDLVGFIDADHEISPTWTAAATDVFRLDAVGAAGALYTVPEPGTWVQLMYGALRGRTQGRGEVAWLGSGNLVVRRAAFEQVGGFDVSLEACEDVDLCQRLRAAGWKIIGDERLKSVHLGDPPTLGALFRAELWRGRDNLRVSLRGPVTAREIPSIAAPILTLIALIAVVASPAAGLLGASPWWVAAAAATAVAALSAVKAIRMASRSGAMSLLFLAQAFVVALTYDIARGIALVSQAPHHRRPTPAPPFPQASSR